MKKLYLIRHAKSSWKNIGESDKERPLNKRGKHDAPLMGKLLRDRGVFFDLIMSSPAVRALTTAKIIAQEVSYLEQSIVINPRIYEASFETMIDEIQTLPNEMNIVAMFGHNPTFSYLANHFGHDLINLPTCGIVMIEVGVDDWAEVNIENSKVIAIDFPKMYVYG